jgi:hypothetical protein
MRTAHGLIPLGGGHRGVVSYGEQDTPGGRWKIAFCSAPVQRSCVRGLLLLPRPAMNTLSRRTRLCTFVLVLTYSGLPFLGSASTCTPAASPASLALPSSAYTLVDHLRGEIRSDDPTRREYALMDVVTLVNCRSYCVIRLQSFPGKTLRIHNDDDFGSVIDVSALTPDLVWAYRAGPTDGLRLLALAGLLYLGDEDSLERVLGASSGVSLSVRRATHRHIIDFFVARYPVLEKQVRRTRRLSRAHIRAARQATAPSGPEKRLSTRYPPSH